MAAHFQLKRAKDGKTYFNLRAANGEVILSSQRYVSRGGALKGIASVRKHAANTANFDRRIGKSGKCHFVLKANNHRIIGTSEVYNSLAAMENGVASVAKNGPLATLLQ